MKTEKLDLSYYTEALRRYFAALDEILLAYLFGSYARSQAGPLSDVDFAVLLAGRPDEDHCFEMRLELIGGLIGLLHTNEVDVLILNQAPPALRYAVLRDGVLVFCRDQQARIEFHMRTINDYLDFKPILKRHGDALVEKARKGELLRGHNPHQGALERYRQLRERFEATTLTDL